MSRTSFIILFICGFISLSNAQDTAKTLPVKAYHHRMHRRHNLRADSAAVKAFAQQPASLKPDSVRKGSEDKSLHGQYLFLLSRTAHYKRPIIVNFWRNTLDTLNINRRKLKELDGKLTLQNNTINTLKASTTNKDQTITDLNTRFNNIGTIGLLSTSTYNLLMWGLVLLFGTAAVLVIVRQENYSTEAKYRTQLFTDLEEEFKNFKIKTNDKEIKVARELQTERNKVVELTGK